MAKGLPRRRTAEGKLMEGLLQHGFGTKQKRRTTYCASPHLFVGVELFVCLMSEPAIRTRRSMKMGKKTGFLQPLQHFISLLP